MSGIHFTKMHAQGNDFVMLENIKQNITITKAFIKNLAHRQLGIGCDQVLLLSKPDNPDHDFIYRIFNADGSEVNQCANGARAAAIFLHQENLTNKITLTLKTKTQLMQCEFISHQAAKVIIPKAQVLSLHKDSLPQNDHQPALSFIAQHIIVGNPHAIILAKKPDDYDLIALGKHLNQHPSFPGGVNVSLLTLTSPSKATLKTFERGVGLTKACGSACLAALIAARVAHQTNSKNLTITQDGGTVTVSASSISSPITLQGDVTSVFRGVVATPKLVV